MKTPKHSQTILAVLLSWPVLMASTASSHAQPLRFWSPSWLFPELDSAIHAAPKQEPAAITGLTIDPRLLPAFHHASLSGRPLQGRIQALASPNQDRRYAHSFDLALNQYRLEVPAGAERLALSLVSGERGADLDLALRYGQPVQVVQGHILADYLAATPGEYPESILLDVASTSQRLRSGTWFAAVGNAQLKAVPFSLQVSDEAGPTELLRLDDGHLDAHSILLGEGQTMAFINRLTPSSYPATLRSIHIHFSDDGQGSVQDFPIVLLVGRHAGGADQISGVRLTKYSTWIGYLNDFNNWKLPSPVTINSGDFLVGYSVSHTAGRHFIGLDSSSTLAQRSYISTDGRHFQPGGSLGCSGNFAIRALVNYQ